MDGSAFAVNSAFYVRPQRTLAIISVRRGSGGPGSVLWRSGWALGLSSGDLAGMAPAEAWQPLMAALVRQDQASPMSPQQWNAWIRTWRAVPAEG